jgi:hypothetical protein
MSQEQRNSTTPSNEPTALTQRESDGRSVLSSIEERLTQADDFQEIVFLTYARKEIIQQDEEAKNQEHQRFLEKAQVWYKMGFSVIAFVVGIGLLIGGLTYPGLLISGAGLFGVAPDYVKAILRIFRKGKGGENAEE